MVRRPPTCGHKFLNLLVFLSDRPQCRWTFSPFKELSHHQCARSAWPWSNIDGGLSSFFFSFSSSLLSPPTKSNDLDPKDERSSLCGEGESKRKRREKGRRYLICLDGPLFKKNKRRCTGPSKTWDCRAADRMKSTISLIDCRHHRRKIKIKELSRLSIDGGYASCPFHLHFLYGMPDQDIISFPFYLWWSWSGNAEKMKWKDKDLSPAFILAIHY